MDNKRDKKHRESEGSSDKHIVKGRLVSEKHISKGVKKPNKKKK